jgi:quinoprotein glucose dehydrogenase
VRCFVGALILFIAAPALAAPGEDWPTYGHDKGGQRFSPLTDIAPANVDKLAVAWVYHMKPPADATPVPGAAEAAQRAAEAVGPPGAPPRRRSRFAGSQVTPLVVDGRMFLTTPYGRVVALDPATGKELWVTPIEGPGQPSQRGLEYWPGDGATPPRLFFGTRDGRLFALDAATGKPAAEFGSGGMIDLKTPEVMQGAAGGGFGPNYGMTSPPIVFRNLVITGSAVQEFPAKGVAGDVRAWDARTGKRVWTFHSVPRKGEPGYQSWQPGSAEGRSGVNAWGFLTVDEARGIVYMPFGAPAWDRYGGDRKGDNLYGTSLVAADAATGKYLWHFQVIRHDIWDGDLEAPPLLFDAKVNGKTIPAVAVTSKSAMVFILDRVTGKPIHPVADRAFPKSDVPGEVTSPTQPVSSIPPLGRTGFAMADVAN